MSQYVLKCVFPLPEDGHDAADIVLLTKDPWRSLLKALEDNGVNYEAISERLDSAPKPVQTGKKRGRKPNSFVQPQISTAPAVAAE